MKYHQEIIEIYKNPVRPMLKFLIQSSFILAAVSANFYLLNSKPPLSLVLVGITLFMFSTMLNKIHGDKNQSLFNKLIYSLPVSFYLWSFVNLHVNLLWKDFALNKFYKIYEMIASGFLAVIFLSVPMFFFVIIFSLIKKKAHLLKSENKKHLVGFFISLYFLIFFLLIGASFRWFFKTDFYFNLSLEKILLPLVKFLIGSLPLGWIYELLSTRKGSLFKTKA